MSDVENDNNDELEFEDAPKRSKKRFITILLFASLALFGTGIGLFMSGGAQIVFGLGSGNEAVSQQKTEDTNGVETDLYKINEIIVNVVGKTPAGREVSRFLKVSLTIVHTPDVEPIISQKEDFLRDSYQAYLRQLKQKDVEGMLGLMKLKENLLRRTRSIVGDQGVNDVLVTELLIQ